MRQISWIVVTLFLVLPYSCFTYGQDNQTLTTSDSKNRTQTSQAFDKEIERTLRMPIDLMFDETPFSEVMKHISSNFGINVVLTPSAIDDSLSKDEPITFSGKSIPLGSALRVLLRNKNATYLVRDSVLMVISLDVASSPEFFKRKIIDCREVLEMIRELESERIGTIGSVLKFDSSTRSMIADGTAYKLLETVNGQTTEQAVQGNGNSKIHNTIFMGRITTAESLLKGAIMSSVATNSWDQTNGDGTLTFIGGCLIVNQTQRIGENVQMFLEELTSTMKQASGTGKIRQ